ncbi:uncharacterized protein LOC120155738 [Hibiscus syriacus]|uniref:uncharacterized protein LOC120155738 n=1 Tax=Hibiscus syriacus TaxID=106335 RepID=UPI001921630F|nr:uncharacterized protein LOC120155738 [Hibiscus syriacus]
MINIIATLHETHLKTTLTGPCTRDQWRVEAKRRQATPKRKTATVNFPFENGGGGSCGSRADEDFGRWGCVVERVHASLDDVILAIGSNLDPMVEILLCIFSWIGDVV